MHTSGRLRFSTALVAALAALLVVHPALSFSHTLEHLEQASPAHAPEEDSPGDHEGGADCDLCLSLSQGRTALASAGVQARVCKPPVGRIEPAVPVLVTLRASRAPESPRAPPLG